MSMLLTVRQEWAEGNRRFESERKGPRYRALQAQLDAVTAELRRRAGSVYTLGDLAAEYGRAEIWSRERFFELDAEDRWAPGLTLAVDAAFYAFARGARDYTP